MFRTITTISAANSTVAVAAAALVAGMAVFLLPAAPDAKAAVQMIASPLAKAGCNQANRLLPDQLAKLRTGLSV